MKFLDEGEVERYYGKDFEDVSPTDTPKERFICGNERFSCPECGDSLEVECENAYMQRVSGGKYGSQGGYTEIAYCENCEIKFKRNRSLVSDDIDYQKDYLRTDEREEYVCHGCKNRHPITKPDGDFEYIEKPIINSLEAVHIVCPCGKRMNINNLELGSKLSCEKCPREFSFSVIE